ncbi:MAG TPA: MmcB family DNA repair protein [Novosphingobium sp.]|nr:MmcB family DNA repair protein [Novosphingobium sp.]
MDPADSPPAPTPEERTARAVARGIARLFARNDIWCLPEMPLRNGRRADLMGIDGKGRIVLVEIKVSRADLLGDGKWTDYLDYCDRYYWGLPPSLDRAPLDTPPFRPETCGVIVARRKVEVERLARAALRRMNGLADPQIAGWGL